MPVSTIPLFHRPLLVFFALTLFHGSVFGAEREAVLVQHELTIQGRTRTFHVHVPANLRDRKASPLVIALHGGGSTGAGMERFSGLSETADQAGFLVVYPDGTGRRKRLLTWNSGGCNVYAQQNGVDDVGFIGALIDFMVKQYQADPARVYLTGISNGAMMAYRLAAVMPGRIAAIATVSGTLTADVAAVRTPVPVLHFHGTEDQYVPFEGGHGTRSITGDAYPSVSNTIAAWVRIDKASPEPVVETLPDRTHDGTQVIRYAYGTKQDPRLVVLYKIVSGGHNWPGRSRVERILGKATTQISANELMWEFFRDRVKPEPTPP
ncbi:MAG: prolyl oligopeptidase family serine peptidase [Lentisphaerae bacterium]|nr:prolyl oligopeptidase family serine peptidase [Lentisphaerota bacterium]